MIRWLAFAVLAVVAGNTRADDFTVKVDAADDQGRVRKPFVYDRDGCNGDNVAPAVAWTGAPAATRSFALTVFDPDAPTGHGWWHWIVLDLPAATGGLSEEATLPAGAFALRNDYGDAGWGGPCPPPGPPHRYVFTVHALDVPKLGLAAGASAADARAALERHSIATATRTLTYGR